MKKNIIITEDQLSKIVATISESESGLDKRGTELAKEQLYAISTIASKMWERLEEGEELEDWMVTKIGECNQSIMSVVKAFLYDNETDGHKGTNSVDFDDLVIGT